MQGVGVVFRKELQDHLSSTRFVILFALIAMVSFITSYMAAMHLKQNLDALSSIRHPFLMLFSTPGELFSMVRFVAFFGPLIGLIQGFDAINRERGQGTLIKVLSQPIYRDSVINGKFLAGVATIAVMLAAIILVVTGFGMSLVGVVPTVEEISRVFIYYIISVFYISFWLGLSILLSILFRNMATSSLGAVALWIFLSFFVSLGAEAAANAIAPMDQASEAQQETALKNARVREMVSLCSPMALYSNATATIIDPMRKTTRTLVLMGPMEEMLSARFQNPLSIDQSIVVVFPYIISLIAITLICFALSYTVFMLQEIRT